MFVSLLESFGSVPTRYIAIKPEGLMGIYWTKVSIDTLVWPTGQALEDKRTSVDVSDGEGRRVIQLLETLRAISASLFA